MSLRPKKQKRSPDPLPNFARQEAARKDVLRTQKIDFDPIHDVEQIDEKDLPCPDMPDDAFTTYPATYIATDFPDPTSAFEAAEATVQELYKRHPEAKQPPQPYDKEVIDMNPLYNYTGRDGREDRFHPSEAWIQTYSGRRFNPMRPIPESIVIQDIAHALSNTCRFGGHSSCFYSVAQHCVLVSYICDSKDALWGLIHDASEAFLNDIPRPLKHSGKMESYIQYEAIMQKAICIRFGLPLQEPESVHFADIKLLATEARDLLTNLRSDWTLPMAPLPFKVVPLPPDEAKHLYLARFFELINAHPRNYAQYLQWEAEGKI